MRSTCMQFCLVSCGYHFIIDKITGFMHLFSLGDNFSYGIIDVENVFDIQKLNLMDIN